MAAKRVATALLLVALAGLPSNARAQQQRATGSRDQITNRGALIWVSAAAVVRNGRLAPDSELPRALQRRRDSVEGLLAKALQYSGPCLPEAVHHDARIGVIAPASFNEMVKNARAIVRGQVLSVTSGFLRGTPHSLIEVDVTTTAARDPLYTSSATVFVTHPNVRLELDSSGLCLTDPNWPSLPSVGDELLLFPQTVPLDADGRLIELSSFEFIVDGASGLDGSPLVRRLEGLEDMVTLNDVETAARDAAAILWGTRR